MKTGSKPSNKRFSTMLFDLWFIGFPIAATICLVNLALKEGQMKYWTCAFSFLSYCAFYLAGGREVLLYICCGLLIAHSWVSVGLSAP